MAQYEVILVQYPNADYPDNLWWTAVCPAMRGCVSDGESREEALLMIADAMASHLEEGPGWTVEIFDEAQAQAEKEITLADCHEEGGVTELNWVAPKFMTEEEIRSHERHLEPIESPVI